MSYKASSFWDPAGFNPDLDSIKKDNEKLLNKEKFIKNNFKKIFGIFSAIFLLILGYLIYLSLMPNNNLDLVVIIFYFFLIPIIALGIFNGYLRNLKKDLVKLKIATDKKWLYNPHKRSDMYHAYVRKFPEIFRLGDRNHNFEDVFWGDFEKDKLKHNFVSGVFNYSRVVRTNKSTTTVNYTDHFFVLKLQKKVTSRLHLYPRNALSGVANLFSKKDIKTESIEFNKTFSFCYEKNNSEVKIDIMKILSPRVIEELVSYSKAKKRIGRSLSNGVKVLFQNDYIMFLSPGPLFRHFKVGLTPKSLDTKDTELKDLWEELNFYLDVSSDISKYIH